MTTVVIVHTETGLRPRVVAAVRKQGYEPRLVLTSLRSTFTYATELRKLWRWDEEWILIEQDVIMPGGTLSKLAVCERDWCTHPHWMGDHLGLATFGVVRFSLRLRQRLPDLMDEVCAYPDPRYWVRRGWTAIERDCSVATLNGPGRRACLRPGAPAEATADDPRLRPTTHDWMGIDSTIAVKLRAQGVDTHIHPEHTIHLHNYETHPPDDSTPWWARPYLRREWEQ